MGTVLTSAIECSGYPPDTYDRYVLGLLNEHERAQLDLRIEQQCPNCLSGVQRSMNLWLVFANSLEQTEPAADFRARLVRIADLSNRILTVPKRHRRVREPAILISSLVVICLIVLTLVIFTWFSGRQSAHMDAERANAELQRLTLDFTQKQVTVQQQTDQIHAMGQKLNSSGPFTVAKEKQLTDSLSKAEAAVQQYRDIIARDSQQTADNSLLLSALSSPGVKLLTFSNAEGVSSSAYALVVVNSKIVFVASKLTPPADQKQYQLWLIRKDEAPAVSVGVFSPAADKASVLTYNDDKESIANLAGLAITEEPVNGSSAPTGPRLFETAGLTQ